MTTGSPDKPKTGKSKSLAARDIAVGIAVALAVVFALLNTKQVNVNWLIGSTQTPLIIVIAVSMLLGVVVGGLLGRGRGKSKKG